MPEERIGKKPDQEGGTGIQESEIAGRSLMLVRCWNCRALNYIPPNWTYFIC